MHVACKIEKVPRGIRGEKSSKDMASSRNLVSTIGVLASPQMGHLSISHFCADLSTSMTALDSDWREHLKFTITTNLIELSSSGLSVQCTLFTFSTSSS